MPRGYKSVTHYTKSRCGTYTEIKNFNIRKCKNYTQVTQICVHPSVVHAQCLTLVHVVTFSYSHIRVWTILGYGDLSTLKHWGVDNTGLWWTFALKQWSIDPHHQNK